MIDNTSGVNFKKVLFCTDFSENADFAFKYAVDAANRFQNCELYLLHVIPESDSQFWKTYLYEVEDVDSKAKSDIDRRVQTYTSKLPKGMKMHTEFRVGRDYQEILNFAEKQKVDLIVIGRQGQSSIQKALFGNVTEKIVRKAQCAVLVVPMSYEKQVNE